MKALTLHQPYATAIVLGRKGIETRSWSTHHRGKLAIHAAASWPKGGTEFAGEVGINPSACPLGAVVAIAVLLDCVPVEGFRAKLSADERALGNYDEGRFAWVLADVTPVNPPDFIRGAQGLWEYTPRLASPLRSGPPEAGPDDYLCTSPGCRTPLYNVTPSIDPRFGTGTCPNHGRVTGRKEA